MSNTEHPAGAAHRSFRCTFGPVREVDLVWPPADEDIDAFTIVHLDDGDRCREPPRVERARPSSLPRRARGSNSSRSSLAASNPRSATVELSAPRLACARWSCRWSRRPCPDRPCPTSRWLGHHPRSLKKRGLRTRRPTTRWSALPRPRRCRFPWPRCRPIPRQRGARRSAWLAVFFAAACVAGDGRRVSRGRHLAIGRAEPPPVPADVSVADVQAPGPPA